MVHPRHAGHHHDQGHKHVAVALLAVLGVLFLLYSLGLVVYGKLRPSKRFRYTVPWWLLTLIWVLLNVIAFAQGSRPNVIWYARRLGRLSISVAAFSLWLVLKPAILPRTYVLPLTSIHKWVARTAILFAVVHTVLYTYAYVARGIGMMLLRWRNLLGILAVSAYVILFFTSLKPVRRRAYWLFYALHYPLAWASVIAMIWHARPDAFLSIELSLVALAFNILYRLCLAKTASVKVEIVSPSMDLVRAPRSVMPPNFEVGCHLRVSKRLYHPLAWLQASHPYTVASLESDENVVLVRRRTRFLMENQKYSFTGPYRAPFDLTLYNEIVVIGGGSGLALVAPVYRQASLLGISVRPVWITRTPEDFNVLDKLGLDSCEIYLTGQPSEGQEQNNEFELEDLEVSDNHGLIQHKPELGENIVVKRFKPTISDIVEGFFQQKSENACLVACGPSALIEDARRWAKGNGVEFFAEDFSM